VREIEKEEREREKDREKEGIIEGKERGEKIEKGELVYRKKGKGEAERDKKERDGGREKRIHEN